MEWEISTCIGRPSLEPEEEINSRPSDISSALFTPHRFFNRNAMNGCVGWKLFIWSPWLCMTPYFVSTAKHASARTGKINFTRGLGRCARLLARCKEQGCSDDWCEGVFKDILGFILFLPKCFFDIYSFKTLLPPRLLLLLQLILLIVIILLSCYY